MKPKIIYLSPDYFFDVDFPILFKLNRYYDLHWYPIIPAINSRFNIDEIEKFAAENNIKYTLSIRHGRRRNIKQLLFSIKLIRKINAVKPDVIYSEYFADPFITVCALVMLPKSKVIYAIHDVVPHTNFQGYFESLFENLLRRHFTFFQIFSKSQKILFDKLHLGKTSFYIPLVVKDFGPSKITVPSKNITKFLFFGNIAEYKGLDLLIKAFESLLSEGVDNISLTIAGKGEFWDSCKSLIKNEKYYNLNIDFIPNSAIPDLFCSHHFLVLPYIDVTQSGPQMIALNYSLPVVASNYDGFRDYIDDKQTGFLFTPKSVDDLKDKLRICSQLTFNEYNDMISRIKSKVATIYQTDEVIKQYNQMFDYVVLNSKS